MSPRSSAPPNTVDTAVQRGWTTSRRFLDSGANHGIVTLQHNHHGRSPEEQRHLAAWLTGLDAFCAAVQDGGQP